MARGTNLTSLIQMTRSEASHSTSVSAGVDFEATIVRKLQRYQEQFYDAYDWPFLREEFSIPLQDGERYYDMPLQMNVDRIEEVAVNYNGRPNGTTRGIGFEQYASINSENGEKSTPMLRWDVKRPDPNKEQIEVWPIPSDNTQTLWFRGIRKLRPLVAPGDVADLDDVLLSLSVATDLLFKSGAKNAQKILSDTGARFAQVKGRSKGASPVFTLSGGNGDYGSNIGKTIIRIGSQTN